jgi:hypothetical protein
MYAQCCHYEQESSNYGGDTNKRRKHQRHRERMREQEDANQDIE